MEGRRIKRWMISGLLSLGLILGTAQTAMAEGESAAAGQQAEQVLSEEYTQVLESVYSYLPDVYLYGKFGEQDGEGLECYFGDQKLEFVSEQIFSETGERIDYYVLLDVSGSIPQNHFKEIKNSILGLQKNLRSQDRLVLCTFGEDVRLLCDGSQGAKELEAVLEELNNRDQKTLLFEAMAQVSNVVEDVKAGECRRRVMIVFSDGEDIAVGKKQAQEALTDLQKKGIPVYAMCIEDTDRQNINSFGEFARATGGELTVLKKGGTEEAILNLGEELLSMQELHFRAPANRADNRETTVSLRFMDSDKTLSKEVMNTRWQPDTEAPKLLEGVMAGSRQLRLTFSEPVLGAETASNYQVFLGEEPVEVSGITVEDGETPSVVLNLAEYLRDGEYTVSCSNITDNSMEENPVANTIVVTVESLETVSDSAAGGSTAKFLIIGVTALVLVLFACFAVWLLWGSKKGRKEPQEELPSDGKNGTQQKIDPGPEKDLDVEISMTGRRPEHTTWHVVRSMIAGRLKDCDIQLDDRLISKQHFALEWTGTELYVMDLNSTNGTYLNKRRIEGDQKVRVMPGDEIKAGSFEIRIKW